ncbi:hypothetical protein WME95_12225 [Sorangium sp. So ce327]|uniref:hypothetical protein n=1 Tax=Sorangium sp. So ce327 TaxID=3133301 RepID=UPI003F60241B
MSRWFRRSTHLLAVIGLLSLSVPATAQDISAAARDIAAAEELFNRGLADMQAGRYETGCGALAESERLDPQPGTLFTLAACEADWGRIATAVTRFGEYLALFERMTPAQGARQGERPKLARRRRDQLSPRVPRLALSLPPGAPAGTVVRRDGLVLGEAALGIPLPVDPGEHVLSIEAPGGPARERRITIAEGETRKLTLELNGTPAPGAPAPPTAAPPPAAPRAAPAPAMARIAPAPAPVGPDVPAAPAARRTAVYVAGGLGAAGLVLGGVMGALVFGEKGVIAEHCGSKIGFKDPGDCDAAGVDAGNSAITMAQVSTVAFGVGLAGLGAAAVLYLTEPKHTGAASSGRRTWVSAGVLEAGPAGAVLGARGGF